MVCNDTATYIVNESSELPGSDCLFTYTGYISGFMFEILLYGINFVIFLTAAYTLVYNLKGYARWVLFASALAMFAISTTNVSLSLYAVFGYLMRKQDIPFRIIRARHVFYFVNNLIGDALLVSLCVSEGMCMKFGIDEKTYRYTVVM